MARATRSPSVSIAYWLAALLLVLGLVAFLAGALVIPGVPAPQVNLDSSKPWLLALTIFLGTKLLGGPGEIPDHARDLYRQVFTYFQSR